MIFFHKIFFTLFLFSIFKFSYSQEWKKNLPPEPNFNDIKKAFYDYWQTKQSSPKISTRDGEWQQFKRWENFMKFRAKGTGKINSSILWEEWEKYKLQKKYQSEKTNSANWTFMGPSDIPGQGGGLGRINTIEFHPANPNIFWIGAACGGLWKTEDGGSTWSTTTDFLPAIGISDIAVDPQNPNNIYIATGDGYGYESGLDFWGGTYTAGVMKSTDGGLTWNSTGLAFNQNSGRIIQRLVIFPSNPQILLAASRDGMWRTTDAGTNWTKVSNVHFYDIEFKTNNDSIVFAASGSHLHRSINKGQTWTIINGGLCGSGRHSIAVTPSNPNVIYSMCEGGTILKSSDGGINFTELTAPSANITFYGYYDNVLAVSPIDENKIFVGGLELGKSTDGGLSWNVADNWYGWPGSDYCHADKHDIAFHPNGNDVFICNDGGIFKTSDDGNSYQDISKDISISQFYRIGGAATDENIFYCGQQDNGVVKNNSGSWDMVIFADGMECAVDYQNPNNVLAATQNGQLNLSVTGGFGFIDVSPSSEGSWITPFVFHPNDPSIVFAGYEQLYKSTDGGWSWAPISNPTNGITMDVLVVAHSNPNYIYAGTTGELHRSDDGGFSWQSISSSLPLGINAISSVAVSNENPLKIWLTLSGYSAGDKVFFSNDGGNSWTNYSGTLPNIPANCIVHQKNSPDIVYAGTDFGIFYRDSTMADWAPFQENLPNVIVSELEIQYNVGKIRAATYGRGVWESPIIGAPTSIVNSEKRDEIYLNIFPNPSSGKINVSSKNNSLLKFSIFNLYGVPVFEKQLQNFPVQIDLSTFPSGIYFAKYNGTSKKIILQK